jgi:hypothetical protein
MTSGKVMPEALIETHYHRRKTAVTFGITDRAS